MYGTPKRFAGAILATGATNIFVPCGGSTYLYDLIKYILIQDVGMSGGETVSLWVGATGGSAAGTELVKSFALPLAGRWEWTGMLKLSSTTYLTGMCNATSSALITVCGERGVNEK